MHPLTAKGRTEASTKSLPPLENHTKTKLLMCDQKLAKKGSPKKLQEIGKKHKKKYKNNKKRQKKKYIYNNNNVFYF